MTTAPSHLIAHCDGGARGNPGPAGAGVSIATSDGDVVAEIAEPLGVQTNNVAEYTAVLRALERAAALGARTVAIVTDSKLLVEQLNGRWKVKNPTLQRLHAEVRAAARALDTVTYRHVRREYNTAADALANAAMDAWEASGGAAAAPAGPDVQEEMF